MSLKSTAPSNLNEDDIDFIKEIIKNNSLTIEELFSRLTMRFESDRVFLRDEKTGYQKIFPISRGGYTGLRLNPDYSINTSIYADGWQISPPLTATSFSTVTDELELARPTTREEPPF